MKTGRIIAGVAAVIIGLAGPAFFMDCDVVCSEKVYDVRLSADTVNIDINDIPESREVQVGINIDNNPGFLLISYWIGVDSRLDFEPYRIYNIDGNRIGIDYNFFENNTVIRSAVTHNDLNSLYSDNGKLYSVVLKIPQDAKPGDFYEVRPILDYNGDSRMPEAFISNENSLESHFGRENFANAVSGGIRITGQLPVENTPEPTPEPTPKPTPAPTPTAKPVTSSKPVTTVRQTQKPQEVKPSDSKNGNSPASGNSSSSASGNLPVSAASDVSVTEITSESSAALSSDETNAVSESKTIVSTVSETTCGETTSEEPVTSEAFTADDGDSRDKKSSGSIAAGLAGITAVAAGFLIYNFRRKGEQKK